MLRQRLGRSCGCSRKPKTGASGHDDRTDSAGNVFWNEGKLLRKGVQDGDPRLPDTGVLKQSPGT